MFVPGLTDFMQQDLLTGFILRCIIMEELCFNLLEIEYYFSPQLTEQILSAKLLPFAAQRCNHQVRVVSLFRGRMFDDDNKCT